MTSGPNTRVNLPPYVARQLKILAAHRGEDGASIVFELIAREYRTLGLEEPKMEWKAPEAAK
jgi:hypothetical protein